VTLALRYHQIRILLGIPLISHGHRRSLLRNLHQVVLHGKL
jgi:hypothetical protein